MTAIAILCEAGGAHIYIRPNCEAFQNWKRLMGRGKRAWQWGMGVRPSQENVDKTRGQDVWPRSLLKEIGNTHQKGQHALPVRRIVYQTKKHRCERSRQWHTSTSSNHGFWSRSTVCCTPDKSSVELADLFGEYPCTVYSWACYATEHGYLVQMIARTEVAIHPISLFVVRHGSLLVYCVDLNVIWTLPSA